MQDYKPGAEEWRISYVAGGIAWRELWICRLICKLVILPGGCPGVEGCWVAGLLGCWVVGLLGCWVVGLLGCWVAGLLGCWVAGLLGCWVAGLPGCRVAGLVSRIKQNFFLSC